jgi:glycosyltransferase involved in cell wall biosynthesis
MKRSVCIISFSPIARDARVLRQIECLAPHYRLTVIGFGEPASIAAAPEGIDWIRLPETEFQLRKRVTSRLAATGLPVVTLLPCPERVAQWVYEKWYWSGPYQEVALEAALRHPRDAYCANDWAALPIAAKAARKHRARLVFDAHEYAPLEFENRRLWRLRYHPTIVYFLRKYASHIDAFTTVCEPIGRRYRDEFGLRPTIVYNTPKRLNVPEKRIDPKAIRLVHHGAAFRDRRLEKMILALAACDPRFSLHFLLVPGHAGYIEELNNLAKQVAAGRVFFHPPVPPEQTAQAVSQYDMGFCLIEPSNYNYLMAAPNKFFDYIAAGMPVCIGPSPVMAKITEQYGLGCVASSFAPDAVAATLNALDGARLAAMQAGARRAAEVFHADAEKAKVVALYRTMFSEGSRGHSAGRHAWEASPEEPPSAARTD